MIHDYKSEKRTTRRHRGTIRTIAAAGLLIATGLVGLWLVDFGAAPDAAPVATGEMTLPLPPPAVREESGSPAEAPSLLEQPDPAPNAPVETPPESVAIVHSPGSAAPAQVATPQHAAPAAAAPGEPGADSIPAVEQTTPAAEEHAAEQRWLEHKIAKGDSLARIFDSHGLDARVLHGIVNSSREAKSLGSIRPGQTIRLLIGDDQELQGLELERSRIETLRVSVGDDGFAVEEVNRDVETRVAAAAGVIESSLFVDGQKAGLSDGVIMQLAAVFGWDIDFALEIRAGDQFRVLYEEHYLDGEKLRDGPILAAEFSNRGHTYRAIRYENHDGEVGYYDVDGHSKRRAFLRTPIKFARVSSRYNPRRWHPVLKRWRSHKGVDYAAPTGTPVKATGDGRVAFRGTKGGYGRTVILEHAGKYTTLYAHLSRYSKRAKTGKRVKQGQVIGYVGKTGLATGPHLHYEFRIDGVHKDPLRVKLPKTLPLPKAEMGRFRDATAPLLVQLEAIPADTLVASAESAGDR